MAKEQQENEHELSSLISDENSFKFDTLSSESLPSIIENDTDIQKQYAQISPSSYSIDLSSLTNSNQLSSIPYIDSSTSLDDQEISKRKLSSSDLSRKISLAETDLVASLHRNLDNSFDDDILFLEWDKERNLFQDYINSLRKEIRVLLQERLEYQQKMSNESKYIHDDQMKIDLLQKSLEEKNFVLEQLQTDYDLIKEKNTNLIRKISVIQCDIKSYLNVIDELKQKIADLTIDLQNHVIVKRRLEISINNLENDCKIIDAERIRLTNDIKEDQHNKQDLEKLLQKSNVQIAEQGSTIEMLRSENVQVRSQLSTIQRRMFQEKQQIMDYLRQIENDLIEKEQIKQREMLLREDYEQLKKSINHDQQKIEELQKECSNLLKTIQIQNEEKNQFQSGMKHLYSHFHIPMESHDQFHLSFQPIENHFNDLQNQCDLLTNQVKELQKIPVNENELRENLARLTTQCAQLDEANHAWQQFHQSELDNFRNKLQNNLPIDKNLSFDEIAQLIVDHLNQQIDQEPELSSFNPSKQIHVTPFEEVPIQNITSVQSTPSLLNEHDEELRQLRENIATLTSQCTQLDEANRAWQQYQQTQLEHFRNKLQDYLPLDENISFDQTAQLIVDQIIKEREEFDQRYQELEKANDDFRIESENNAELIRQSYLNTVNELNQKLLAMKEHDTQTNESPSPDSNLIDQQTSQLQSNLNELKHIYEEFQNILPTSTEASPEEIISYINNLIKDNNLYKEKENTLTKDLEHVNQQLINVYHQCEQLQEYNKQLLVEKQTLIDDDQIKQNYILLQNQCTQLDNANRAWQQFYDNQMEMIKNQLKDYLDFDKNLNFDQIIQMIASEFQKQNSPSETTAESADSSNRSSPDSQEISNLQEEIKSLENQLKDSQSSIDLLKNNLQLITYENEQLKQQYNEIQEKYDLLIKDTQNQTITPVQSSNIDEIQQLQTNLSLPTTQHSQLDEANHAWQQFHQNQLEHFRNKLQDYIPLDESISFHQVAQLIVDQIIKERKEFEKANHDLRTESKNNLDSIRESYVNTIKELNQELIDIKEQCQEFERINKQLLIENENLNDRSIVVGHHSQIDLNLVEQPIEQNHIAMETIPFDSTHMINQQTQTESLWSISDDENLINTNERLNDYINEISSLSPIELSKQLNHECEQILSKQNLKFPPNLELNQLALIALNSLSNQHLIDEAKQLYDETVIRALKQEYELINNEKDNLIQQIDLERSQSEELIKKLSSPEIEQVKYEFPSEKNTDDQQQINDNDLETIKDKIDQIVDERPELFPDSTDDTIERFDQLISAIEHQATQIDLLKNELNISAAKLLEERNQEEIHNLISQLSEREEQIEELNQKYAHISSNIETQLIPSSSRMNQTIDNETQTDDQQHDKLVQTNNKLKRALQTIKDKIHRIAGERPELFPQMSDDTIERLDQLISAVENQTKQIEILQNVPLFEGYQKQIDQLQQNLSQKEEEQILLQDRLHEVELELRKTLDDQSRPEALVEQQSLQLTELQREVEHLREQLAQLKQPDITSDEIIQSLKETIEQQLEELNDLSEKYLSQVGSHEELNRQKKEIEERLNEHQTQIDNLTQERAQLLEEIEKKTVSSKQTIDNESQTDDHQHEKLVQVNNKLKRALQTFKEKLHRIVTERPDLFESIGEETSERLDHLISTVENQATQIAILHAKHDQVEEELRNQIKQLQSSLETSHNERQEKIPSTEDYQKQIEQLQQNLSENEKERNALSERLSEVELELRKTIDEHESTMSQYESLLEARDTLGEQAPLHSAESQLKIQQVKEQLPDSKHLETQTDEDIKALHDMIQQQFEQIKDLNEKNANLLFQLESQTDLTEQKREIEERLTEREDQIDNLIEERVKLLEEIEKKTLPSMQTTDHESQTDDHQHEKLVQMNNKLKRALQTFKEKIHRVVTERPDLFEGIGEETNERLDHLISTAENQATQVSVLQAERDQIEQQLQSEIKELQSSLEAYRYQIENEHPTKTEQLVHASPDETFSSSVFEDYGKLIDQLQENLSEKKKERKSISDHLNEVEVEHQRTLDNYASILTKYESGVEERDALAQERTSHSTESQREIDQLKQELADIKQSPDYQHVEIQTDEDIKALHETIEQQSQQLKDLNEKNTTLSSELNSRAELIREKKEIEERLNERENQIDNLIEERAKLLEEIAKKILPRIQTTDNQSQTDDGQHEKLVQVNNKLKRALQIFKDKIHHAVDERPDLFHDIGEDTNERLDHLISTVDNQAIEIDVLQTERDRADEKHQSQIKELQCTLEACQYELDNERRMKMERLVSAPSLSSPPTEEISSSIVDDYQKQIKQLQQNLSQKDEERTLLRERLNEVELELRKTLDDHASTMAKYEILVEERDALVQQEARNSEESQRKIEQLIEELAEFKQLPTTHHVSIPTDEDIKLLHESIEQQSEQIKDLNEKNATLSLELDRQKKETEERINDYENQIETLMQERTNLLEEIEKKVLSSKQTIDNETQTEDDQREKLKQVNNKLKRALQIFKDKIQRVVTERPNLFDGIGEETGERLDHLISTVENQATQIDVLQAERDQVEEELRNEIKQLQSSLETSQNELDNERQEKMEQLSSQSENYKKQIEELQQNLSDKDNERSSLTARLNEVEAELRKTIDDHALKSIKHQEDLQSFIEEHQRDIEKLKKDNDQVREELVVLKQPIDCQHVEIQTDEDINAGYSNVEFQAEVDRQQNETEEQIRDYKNQLDNLIQERANLLEEMDKKILPPIQTTDNESQTDNRQYEKLVQVNNKLKRALQTFKDKIHRAVDERPDLFHDIGEDTSERLDHLISTVENQATEINLLQVERAQVEEQLQDQIKQLQSSLETSQNELDNERREKMKQLSSQSEDYQKQIEQLQENLSEKEDERTSLSERLSGLQLELKKIIDEHTSTMNQYKSLLEERDTPAEQAARHSAESQREIEQLKEELAELKQTSDYQYVQVEQNDDNDTWHDTTEQEFELIKDLNEKNGTLLSAPESQTELIRQKKETEEQLNEHKNQIENLLKERANLLEEIEKKTAAPIQAIDNESQTEDHQHEELVQVNNKLERALQAFKEKIDRAATETPDLFNGIGEDTNQRLDHLISTVENQAAQISVLQVEHGQLEEQLQNEIKQLQSSLETSQNELENERREKVEQLSSQSEDYQNQIQQLEQNLFEKESERNSLNERLNEVELELNKTLDDHAMIISKYESVVEERDALVQEGARRSTESEREIKQLKEELAELKQSPDYQHVEIQTDEDIEALDDMIEQQSEQIKDLNEKNANLSSQLQPQAELAREKKEIEQQLNEHKNQIENLLKERASLLEKNTVAPVQTIDNEVQTDDREYEELIQVNNYLKHVVQIFKDKIHRVVTERPDLFEGIGEEISQRLDHLISTVENQATKINVLEAERDQVEQQLQSEVKDLQSSLEAYRYQIENEHPIKTEQLVHASPVENTSSLVIGDYQKLIDQLQEDLSEKENERKTISERLDEVELELKRILDNYASLLTKYGLVVEERDALIQEGASHLDKSQGELDQLKQELAELKQSSDYQYVQVQEDEDIESWHDTTEQEFELIKDLSEKDATVSSQLESQVELSTEKKETEEQLIDHKNQTENLLEEIEKNTGVLIETIDNECQTYDREREELVQVNNYLKHVVQTFKDKIHRVVTGRPDLFDGISEEISERLDHLISTVENQATQVNVLQTARDQVEEQLQNEIKPLQSSFETSQNELDNEPREKIPPTEDYQKQIEQLQQNLSERENEQKSISEHLDEVKLELEKTLCNYTSILTKYESLIEERDALVQEEATHSAESQREIDQLKQELANLKQSPDYQHVEIQTEEDIKVLHDMIEQQSEQIKDLSEKNTALSSQLESQTDLIQQKKEIEGRLTGRENQIDNLMTERAKLLEEIEKNIRLPIQTIENEVQTNDDEHEKLLEVNKSLKSALETIEDKIQHAITARSDPFGYIGGNPSERLDHLISTIQNQTGQIDVSRAEHSQIEEQLQNEIKQLQSSLETSQNELDNERREKIEQLSSQSENYKKQIEELQQNLSEKDNERSSLSERLYEVELELKKAIDNQASTMTKYELLVEQEARRSTERQCEIDQLQQELADLKQSPDYQHVEIQTDEDIKALHETIEQQSKQIKDLNEKNANLSSQLESQTDLTQQKKEIEERLTEHENQIDNLQAERAKLLEEIEKNIRLPIQTIENEVQTDDDEHDKLLEVNKSLKSALETIEDKIQHAITARSDPFGHIRGNTSEPLDHLISTIQNQTGQIDALKAERSQVEEQLQKEIKQLQSSLETSQNELDNERQEKIEQLSSQSENYKKQIEELQQNVSDKDNERSSLTARLNEIEAELRKTIDDHALKSIKHEEDLQSVIEERNTLIEQQTHYSEQHQHELEQLKKDNDQIREELAVLKQPIDSQHVEIQTDEDIKALHDMIEQQCEQIKDLNEKNTTLSSQLESQTDLIQQKKEMEERLTERENQIDNLQAERAKLLEEIEKNIRLPILTIENETLTDDEYEKLLEVNKSLKCALETIDDKIQHVITARSDLFGDIGRNTSERLDGLISTIQNQTTQIDALKSEHDETKEKYEREMNDLQNSFDIYRQQTDKYISSLTPPTHEIETQTIDFPTIENQHDVKSDTQIPESDDNESNNWFDASPDTTDKGQIDYQQSSLPLSTPNSTQTEIENENLKNKIHQILVEYSTLLSPSNNNPFENLDQIISLIKNLENEIKELQSSFDTYRNEIENDHLIKMEELKPNHVHTQTLGLSILEEYEKQIKKLQENELVYQREIELLTEEKNQAQDLLSQWKEESKEINNYELNHDIDSNLTQSNDVHEHKIDVEIQTMNDSDLSSSSDQSISRHMFEQEMLAWSKESEQLKHFVKQIQIENNKLKDIILKFEQKIHDYMNENERLKQENQHLSLINYSSIQKDHLTVSDDDICYLTLKWLTYEVAQRTSNHNNEQLSFLTNDSQQDLQRQYNDTKQMKTLRVQNERLKNQLEAYTIQFKHVQHEMSIKLREMSILKDDVERLRMNEMQSHLEILRLKADLEENQFKIQDLESELANLKSKQSNNDTKSINNLHELLELKERELNALKEKLDYTKQTHQIELQEALKANQFSLDNVKRFEQMDLSHEEKRRELETRLGKFCTITRPLIHNQELFIEHPIINIDELRKLIAETDTKERITSSLSPIRDCLSLLEGQMKDLHHSIIENHARRSKRWKYKLGFECLSCESRWEVTHDIRDLQQACLDPHRFLETSLVEPMAGCLCPIMIDFAESDIRLCLDDILDDVVVRTTVK